MLRWQSLSEMPAVISVLSYGFLLGFGGKKIDKGGFCKNNFYACDNTIY